MRVSFIGSGNVATHLANACVQAGITVIDIYSPTHGNAEILAKQCKARAILNISDLDTNIDLLLISVPDDALSNISKQITSLPCPVVHTAGSVSIDVLKSDEHAYGVLYPLQTFSKSKEINIEKVPFFIESSTEQLEATLINLLDKLNAGYTLANSEQRMHLHIAAVFACNFTNYMYQLAHTLCKEQNLSFEALIPLIQETAEKIKNLSPKEAQTGPAKRADDNTMQKHLKALEQDAAMHELYKLISEGIRKNHNS